MRNDPAILKDIKPGDIFQIVPEEDHGYRLRLMVVTEVKSWGVAGNVGGEMISRTWNLIEPTGGRMVFDASGKRIGEQAPVGKHHP